jgi:two-component system, NtrC family, sensor kinase
MITENRRLAPLGSYTLPVLILTVIQGPDKGRKYELPENEPQLIGRSSEALPMSDNAVSRRHAELTPDEGTWWIRDLHSQNGTYVNGVRIGERTRLRPGDQIRTGQTLFVFGQTETRDAQVVRVVGPTRIDASIERTMPSRSPGMNLPGGNEDSVILAVPEPRLAAMDHLRVMYKLTSLLTSKVTDRHELLKGVLDLVFSEFRADRGCIMMQEMGGGPSVGPGHGPGHASSHGSGDGIGLAEEGPSERSSRSRAGGGSAGKEPKLTPEVVKYREAPLSQDEATIHVSRTILQHVVTKGEGVLSSNAMSDPRFAKGDSVQRFHIRSAVCSPIKLRDRTYGAIYIDSSIANYTFTQDQLALLNAIGQHTGLAIANAELYAQKLQSERLAAIGETVATLSHSIKNILQGLRGGADVVEMGLKKDDLKIAKGGWGILQRNLHRIISLTMNMLAFSRQRRVEVELTPLGPLIQECAALLHSACVTKQVAMIVDVDPDMPPVPVDAPLLHQAMMNLLTNAVEAVEAGEGAVTVKTVYKPSPTAGLTKGGSAAGVVVNLPLEVRSVVEISVIDNGPGIPASKQPWVFEPFNTTKGVKGTGLGLAVAKRIAEEHGGRITLESNEGRGGSGGGGGGATFRIVLPVDGQGALDPSATATSREKAGDANLGDDPKR